MLATLLFAAALCQQFEAASVHVSEGKGRTRMQSDPGQITYTNATLFNILLRAYDLQPYQLAGPDWISTAKYDIAAKIPAGATKEQVRTMLQNLLAERFHAEVHHETRALQGFELVAGRGGAKLRESAPSGTPADLDKEPRVDSSGYPELSGPGLLVMEGVRGTAVVSFLTARAQPVSALTERLSKEFRLPILDKTGLAGTYDFKLEFAPERPGALSPDASDQSAANLISAVQQQLGLKLNPAKIPTDVVVLDRAEKIPAAN
jgi:uncharacterized protein (TIGR03435 family)